MKQFALTIFILFFFNVNAFSEHPENALFSMVANTLEKHGETYDVKKLISNGEWNIDKTAMIIHIPNGLSSLLYVFVKQDGGAFVPVDISYRVNSEMNHKLGRSRSYYDKYVQTPVVSQRRDEYIVGVGIITQAWKDGQHYTVESKPTLIRQNGRILNP
jgi:hypothetical protein